MEILSGRLSPFITTTASFLPTNPNLARTSTGLYTSSIRTRKLNRNTNNSDSFERRATKNGSSYSINDYDLYDLLGVDSSCDQTHIKQAYRTLQKRCHPDIAGPTGHDMAIVLNEAYAVLSDPNSRFGYDKKQAKISELRGYTGKPLYSVWFGSENEERAVFVDEVKCVGCLKCALFAEKTFAVESVYGRARVVAQWADPEHKIQEAIESCPVDCISIVERSNLAALEFLMSKQPRGKVRIGVGNTVGASVANIFVDVEKFQAKYREAMNKASKTRANDSAFQREARNSAVQAIKAISNWMYWKPPNSMHQHLTQTSQKPSDPNIDKLRNVAAARKQAWETSKPISRAKSSYMYGDEYWVPSTIVIPEKTKSPSDSRSSTQLFPYELKKQNKQAYTIHMNSHRKNSLLWSIPLGISTGAAAIVGLGVRGGITGDLKEHAGGSLALDIVNSPWLPVILAGLIWYLISAATIEIIQAFLCSMESNKMNREDI